MAHYSYDSGGEMLVADSRRMWLADIANIARVDDFGQPWPTG